MDRHGGEVRKYSQTVLSVPRHAAWVNEELMGTVVVACLCGSVMWLTGDLSPPYPTSHPIRSTFIPFTSIFSFLPFSDFLLYFLLIAFPSLTISFNFFLFSFLPTVSFSSFLFSFLAFFHFSYLPSPLLVPSFFYPFTYFCFFLTLEETFPLSLFKGDDVCPPAL